MQKTGRRKGGKQRKLYRGETETIKHRKSTKSEKGNSGKEQHC